MSVSRVIEELGHLIDGEIVRGGELFPVENPGTGEIGARCPAASAEQLDAACRAAAAAQPAWAQVGEAERREVIRAMGAALTENVDVLNELAEIEKGVPFGPGGLPVATGEVFLAHVFAEEIANTPLPVDLVEDSDARRVEVVRVPVGVVAAISAWNGPIFLAAQKAFHALLVGNTVVAKPSPFTPLTSLYMGTVWKDIVPPGVVNIVAGGNDIGAALVSHPAVRLVSFTGGVAGGRAVAVAAAGALKNVVLELGGNDAAIVLPDVDVSAVARRVYDAAFTIAGQACLAIKRLFVHESIFDAMVAELAAHASREVAATAREGGTFPPITTRAQFDRVRLLVEDALAQGAVAVTGGRPVGGRGNFYPPTVLTDVMPSMSVVAEEQFGPVLPVIRYVELDDAVAAANGTEYGLCGSVWSADVEKASAVAARLVAGTVYVNSHGDVSPSAPFGGCRASGVGRECGRPGIDAYAELQTRVVHKT
ncbi:Acyl-CoA reductase [Parafrankia irregularis]|uniref:Acyl-CoA reductase n=1 Tax=Parafrankia irregularis TaxID=795642 RepID=A0A0S4QWP7_9ACTN|nr:MULTISPECIES: aldehyde dehydrogenase family protein [Parafrankia]MBE3199964.1 aldehyde dehydrogenase family protein [Parafrankia sp. CH37]CUU59292.1 Acyl-CoA reductase [Parafrankia irregularis]